MTGSVSPEQSTTPSDIRPASGKLAILTPGLMTSEIVADGPPLAIRCEIRDAEDNLLTVCDFEYVLLPEKKFRALVGIDELPNAYIRHFSEFVPLAK